MPQCADYARWCEGRKRQLLAVMTCRDNRFGERLAQLINQRHECEPSRGQRVEPKRFLPWVEQPAPRQQVNLSCRGYRLDVGRQGIAQRLSLGNGDEDAKPERRSKQVKGRGQGNGASSLSHWLLPEIGVDAEVRHGVRGCRIRVSLNGGLGHSK